jgi:hypothetical protein
MAARLAAPINMVAIIMGSPPSVGLFRGEQKDAASGVIGADFPGRGGDPRKVDARQQVQ